MPKKKSLYIGLSVSCAIVCIGIGVLCGYFIAMRLATNNNENNAQHSSKCEFEPPRTYIAYHLSNKNIYVDGLIGDDEWNEVDFTQPFVDVRGKQFPTPDLETKAKIRWDDDYLYIAALLEAKHIWAFKTIDETKVWRDNAFEVYVDADGSTHNYKEMQINALGTTWDLMLTKAYMDGGVSRSQWYSEMRKGVFIQGTINNSADTDRYWSVEFKIPFRTLMYNTSRIRATPEDGEIWRIVLARPEWAYRVDRTTGGYVQLTGSDAKASWWSWNPHGAVNLHLPDRWGYLQFSRQEVRKAKFEISNKIKLEKALFDTFNAMKAYQAVYDIYPTTVELLILPPYLKTDGCYHRPEIKLKQDDDEFFIVSIGVLDTTSLIGHIRSDRLVWYGHRVDDMPLVNKTIM